MYDKRFFDFFDDANEVLKDYPLVEKRRRDLDDPK